VDPDTGSQILRIRGYGYKKPNIVDPCIRIQEAKNLLFLAWSNMSTVQIASVKDGVWRVSVVIDAAKVIFSSQLII